MGSRVYWPLQLPGVPLVSFSRQLPMGGFHALVAAATPFETFIPPLVSLSEHNTEYHRGVYIHLS